MIFEITSSNKNASDITLEFCMSQLRGWKFLIELET